MQTLRQEEDLLLWQQFRAGDAFAMGVLAKKFYSPLFHYGTKFTKEAVLIEDCIQEVFLRLWDRRESLGDTPSPKFYLFKALRHQLIKSQQRQHKKGEPLNWETEASSEENAEQQLIQQEQLDITYHNLQAFVADLPKRQQEALYLRYYENLSYEDIALIMGIHSQSVANLLQNSLKSLRGRWPASTLILLLHLLGL
jgi:RNA polymerase sigma factor (sigma-70 family)